MRKFLLSSILLFSASAFAENVEISKFINELTTADEQLETEKITISEHALKVADLLPLVLTKNTMTHELQLKQREASQEELTMLYLKMGSLKQQNLLTPREFDKVSKDIETLVDTAGQIKTR